MNNQSTPKPLSNYQLQIKNWKHQFGTHLIETLQLQFGQNLISEINQYKIVQQNEPEIIEGLTPNNTQYKCYKVRFKIEYPTPTGHHRIWINYFTQDETNQTIPLSTPLLFYTIPYFKNNSFAFKHKLKTTPNNQQIYKEKEQQKND